MSYVSDFSFGDLTRINNDQCFLDQRSIQNTAQCNYMTQNFFSSDSTMARPISLATSQPGVFFKGGHSVSSGGYNIDDSSFLQRMRQPEEPISKLDLFARPFVTVPFLGRGAVNPDIEHRLMQGSSNINRKTHVNAGETSSFNYVQTPLIPEVQSHMDNLSVTIEDSNTEWRRGGIPTRELNRDVR